MNRQLFNEKAKKKGFTMDRIAKGLDMNRATYYRKLALSGETFTVREIKQICDLLKLNRSEAHKIFFAD
ncbi:MAG: hypothetical protein K2H85_00710 [Allobaculum sp.]|nr:hypothetical protein [Allobaculum sp.]